VRAAASVSARSPGATAVQVAWSSHHGSLEIEHLGSAHDDAELELLKTGERQRLVAEQGELDLGPDAAKVDGPLPIASSRMSGFSPSQPLATHRRLPGQSRMILLTS
jgi:hypothetical protein